MKPFELLRWTAFVLVFFVSCAAPDEGGSSGDDDSNEQVNEDASDDGEQDNLNNEDDSCHTDCFGGFSCQDGEVREYPHGPIPCDLPEYEDAVQECENGWVVGQCEEGCSVLDQASDELWPGDWTTACEEGRDRIVGDSCEGDDDCAPAYPGRYASPDVEKSLVCDETRGECVETDFEDYLAECEISDVEFPEDGDDRYFVYDGECSESACLLVESSESEICQFCTRGCESHADCPAGSVCRSWESLGAATDPRAGTTESKVCQPEVAGQLDCGGN